jgi:proline dehydrogenase
MINFIISKSIDYVPGSVMYPIAKRYIAGVTLKEAISLIKKLNRKNIKATVDILGEHTEDRNSAIKARDEYIHILNIINEEKLDSNISLKPTHLGINVDRTLAEKNIEMVTERAKELGNFVRIDMENSPYTDVTIEIYKNINALFPENVGTVLQAYLRRTIKDVEILNIENINIRLCKGVYSEPRKLAYKDKYIINRSYTCALEELFKKGAYVGIATHDEKLVFEAEELIRKYKYTSDRYEFQMLLGVDEELRDIILQRGHTLRIYVPYGAEWLTYCRRRIKENPSIAKMSLKQLFKS